MKKGQQKDRVMVRYNFNPHPQYLGSSFTRGKKYPQRANLEIKGSWERPKL